MNRLRSLSFRKEYFIFLLPLFYILHGLNEHYGNIPVADAAWLLAEYELATIIAGLLASLFFRSLRKGCLFGFVVMCVHFFFGSWVDWIKEVMGTSFLLKYSFILPFFLVIFFGLLFFLKRTALSFNRTSRYLNFLLVFLVVFELASLGIKEATNPEQPITWMGNIRSKKPDIYLLLVDGYAGRQQLQDIFGFSNAAFEDSLKRAGFYVVAHSASNYKATVYSMTSLFGMTYLEGVTGDESYEELRRLYPKLNNNPFIKFLNESGYDIKNFSPFRFNGEFPVFPSHLFPSGTSLITRHTFLGRMQQDLSFHLVSTLKLEGAVKKHEEREAEKNTYVRMREHYIMDSVVKLSAVEAESPRFFYIHLLMPHGPYHFDRHGNPMKEGLSEKEGYIEYLHYTNRKLLEWLGQIKTLAAKPPLILLMSDHGFRTPDVPDRYKYMNLNAVFFPDSNYASFYEGISNVNQLRVVLNSQLGQKLPLLKDSLVR
jgi:hypothetical protein